MRKLFALALLSAGAATVITVATSCGSSSSDSATTTLGGGVLTPAGGKGGAGGLSGSSGHAGAAGLGGVSASMGGSGGAKGGASGKAGAGGSGGTSGGAGGVAGAGMSGAGGKGGGAPMCTSPSIVCGQSCADLTTDPQNCGKCGHACPAGASCCDSLCETTTSCASLSLESVMPAFGWQNGGGWVTLKGKGFVKGAKVFLADGRAPALVKDATTILLQTPPHPVGTVDIRVEVGAASVVVDQAFTYQTEDVELPWETKPMKAVRGEDPGIAVLQDGRALVAGGTTVPDDHTMSLNTAETYDRALDKVAPATNTMSTQRWQLSAVTLLDGRALVVGGSCESTATTCSGDATLADLFDPTTNSFTPTKSPLTKPRVYTRSVLLPDGKVLIASSNDESVEVFDPETETFTLLPHTGKHVFGFMVRLRDGRVMLGGGDPSLGDDGKLVEIFDPDTMTFTSTSALASARAMATAHTLPDGRVVVIGGADKSAGSVDSPQATMEVWSALTSTWATSPVQLLMGRAWHASALIRDGSILVLGGYTMDKSCVPSDTAEQVDLVKQSVVGFGTLPNPNTEWVAATLLDGSVLAVGGGACNSSTALPDMDFLPGKKQ